MPVECDPTACAYLEQERRTALEYAQSLLDILQAARDIVASADANGQITFLNRMGRLMLKIDVDEDLSSTSITDYHPAPVAEMLINQVLPHCARAGFWEGETEFRRRDGSIFSVSQIVVAHRRQDGTLSHFSTIARDISERRQSEQALGESEERLRLALASANQGLYDLDLRTGATIVNPEYASMLGYDPEIFHETNAAWIERLHPDDAERVSNVFDAYVSGLLNEYRVEFRQRTMQGTWKWILSMGKIVAYDGDGKPLRMLGTHTDITERKATEEALRRLNQDLEQRVEQRTAALQASQVQLRESQIHLLAAQRIASLGSWEFDVGTGQINWSDQVYRIFGRDPDSGPPSFAELEQHYPPLDRERHRQAVEQSIASQQPYEIELSMQRSDGAQRIIQARGEPVLDHDGQLIRLVGTVQDLTERKQGEAQRRNLADRLALAVKSAALGIWDWDIVKDELTWDRRMYELYGISADTFTSTYDAWANGLHPEDRSPAEQAIQLALHGEKEFDTEFRVVHPDGNIRYIKAFGLIQRDQHNAPLRMIGINFDITERKQAELREREISAQLRAANHELEAFAYSVSHDLRAPLRAVDGFSKAFIEDYEHLLDATGRDYLSRIRGGVQRMGMLIDDLLRLSRVSRSDMQYQQVDLSALVQRLANELYNTQPERQVQFIIAPGVRARVDPNLIRIALDNLLQNAWKFTSKHATACIEFGVLHQEEQRVYFVRDDGAGFDMAFASKLFGVFQRLHDHHEFPGTGIGLATVQRVIARHGGRVWATSGVEQGACFYFTLAEA